MIAVFAFALSSCATFTENSTAASVNGTELSTDDLGTMLDSALGQAILQVTPTDGFIDGNSARGLLGAWIALNALGQAGIGTEADREGVEADLVEQFGADWDAAPAAMKELASANLAVGRLLQSGARSTEELQAIIAAAEVRVDSRYGRWNSEQSAVVALG